MRPKSPVRMTLLRLLGLVPLVAIAAVWVLPQIVAAPPPTLPTTLGSTLPSVSGVPIFSTWPKDTPPAAAILLSGQTFGYLRPCGCSVNQKGGLERRANLLQILRDKGWPIVGADLGDLAPNINVREQDLLKYKYTMMALREMGYVAVGIGEQDFQQKLWDLLATYTYQTEGATPTILAANLAGIDEDKKVTPREKLFEQRDGKRPAVEAIEVAMVGEMAVGFASVIAGDLKAKIATPDPNLTLTDDQVALRQAAADLNQHPKKPTIQVLLYQGLKEEALKIAAKYPQFQVILCLSGQAESEPPQFATMANAGRTMIIQVGHKAQNVGVVGVFPTVAGGFELKYQLVPLTEDFLTPEAKVREHKVLALLEKFALDVKNQKLL
ncbi:MAG: hypothetical protein ACRCZF_09410, partial [Gemmataceae bacterium]